jgi:hypothetical protein
MPRDEGTIRAFLLKAKKTLSEKQLVHFVPTSKTMQELAGLGLQVGDVFRIISKLEPRHWHSGPEADRNGSPGEVFVFMYPYARELLYIKLKVSDMSDGSHLTILSFHEEGQHGHA